MVPFADNKTYFMTKAFKLNLHIENVTAMPYARLGSIIMYCINWNVLRCDYTAMKAMC